MDYDNNDRKQGSVYSRKLRAGKRRTYFFDVRETRGSDFFVTITETRKRFNDDGFERQKIFIYKEDFNKFTTALGEAIMHVKTELMPDFDFDHYNHEDEREEPRYRSPKNRSGYTSKEPHRFNNDGNSSSKEFSPPHYNNAENGEQMALDQKTDFHVTDNPSGQQETEHIIEEKKQAQQPPVHGEIEETQECIDTADIQAEPMHAPQTTQETTTDIDENLVNVTSTSDKLASEEVEKW